MSDNEQLTTLLLRWEESWEQGEEISAAELCENHPS